MNHLLSKTGTNLHTIKDEDLVLLVDDDLVSCAYPTAFWVNLLGKS